MSLIQQIPDGLKKQEVERGNGRFQPPIPYIPEKLIDVDPDRKPPTIKIELSNGVESRVVVWEGTGTKEQFLCHMISVKEALDGMGLFKAYKEAEIKLSEAKSNAKEARDSKEELINSMSSNPSNDEKEGLQAAKETHKLAKQMVDFHQKEKMAAMATIFSTTANFFRGDGKTPWDKIVTEQTESDPWTNLRGVEQTGIRGKTMTAWEDCYILMKKSVFANNAAEEQKFYLTLLRLSPKQKVRGFLQRAITIAGYVSHLPGIIHSRDATETTERVEPYKDSEFATIMLQSMPHKWVTQYNLGHKAPPNTAYLQNALKKIEQAFPLGGGNGGAKHNASGNQMSSMKDKIPKKETPIEQT